MLLVKLIKNKEVLFTFRHIETFFYFMHGNISFDVLNNSISFLSRKLDELVISTLFNILFFEVEAFVVSHLSFDNSGKIKQLIFHFLSFFLLFFLFFR